MSERDWQTDWELINKPFPIPHYPDGTLRPDYFSSVQSIRQALKFWLQRVRGLEDVLKDVQRIVGRALEDVMQEKTAAERRVRELEEKTRKLEAVARAAREVYKQWTATTGYLPPKSGPVQRLFKALAVLEGEGEEFENGTY